MYAKMIRVINKTGLHARPANNFVKLAKKYESRLTVKKDSEAADAKSIISILQLCILQGMTIEICGDGEDEKEAVEALNDYLIALDE